MDKMIVVFLAVNFLSCFVDQCNKHIICNNYFNRMSKEFENLPSYDDIVGVEEETVQEKGKSRHAVVDKSKKRNQAPGSSFNIHFFGYII